MNKPKLFIDTEFNGFNGELISMALVGKKEEFYEVIKLSDDIEIDPWVKENVMPVLNKSPLSRKDFQHRLNSFLDVNNFPNGFVVIADWPDDIKYFCQSIILRPGITMEIASFEMIVDFSLSSEKSKVPHNAQEDARSIMRFYPHE